MVSEVEVETVPEIPLPVIVIGDAPRTLNPVQETAPAHVTDVVATEDRFAVPFP